MEFLVVIFNLLVAPQSTMDYHGIHVRPPARELQKVLVIRRGGCQDYETIAEEFRGAVRADVRSMILPHYPLQLERFKTTSLSSSKKKKAMLHDSLMSWFSTFHPDLIFVIGQSAYDILRHENLGPVLYTHVFHQPLSTHNAVFSPIPKGIFINAFLKARPKLKTIGVVHGQMTARTFEDIQLAATQRNVNLQDLNATSPAHAIQLLRKAKGLDAIWLLTDLEIITSQVFQYALGIQFRKKIPLMGAVFRQTRNGALFSIDYNLHAIGRHAAHLANTLLSGRKIPPDAPGQPHLTINRRTAKTIGVSLKAFDGSGVEFVY